MPLHVHCPLTTPGTLPPSGYVPPYTPNSKYYNLADGTPGRADVPGPGANNRNPVLQHLDQVGVEHRDFMSKLCVESVCEHLCEYPFYHVTHVSHINEAM